MEKVKVTTTTNAPFHKPGVQKEVVQSLADRMIAQGWATEGWEDEPVVDNNETVADMKPAAKTMTKKSHVK